MKNQNFQFVVGEFGDIIPSIFCWDIQLMLAYAITLARKDCNSESFYAKYDAITSVIIVINR